MSAGPQFSSYRLPAGVSSPSPSYSFSLRLVFYSFSVLTGTSKAKKFPPLSYRIVLYRRLLSWAVPSSLRLNKVILLEVICIFFLRY